MVTTVQRPVTYSFFRWTLKKGWDHARFLTSTVAAILAHLWRECITGHLLPILAQRRPTHVSKMGANSSLNPASCAAEQLINLYINTDGFSVIKSVSLRSCEHLVSASRFTSFYLENVLIDAGPEPPENILAIAVAMLKISLYSDQMQAAIEATCSESYIRMLLKMSDVLPWPRGYRLWLELSGSQPQQLAIIAVKQNSIKQVPYVSRSPSKEVMSGLCAVASAHIAALLPLSVHDGVTNACVSYANRIRRYMQKKQRYRSLHGFDTLKQHIAAARLGLPLRVLQLNQDFFVFATSHFLHRYLFVYGHELRCSESEIFVKCNGSYQAWKHVRQLVSWTSSDSPPSAGNNAGTEVSPPLHKTFKGRYSSRGLINEGICDWKLLEPFIRVLPPAPAILSDYAESSTDYEYSVSPVHQHDWGNRFLLEICLWIVDEPRISGDHAWLRLKTNDGLIYSVGQYRPGKTSLRDHLWLPMQIKTSQFQSPDISEFWNGPYTSLQFEVSKEHFELARQRMELDQKAQIHVYQLFHGNCVNYAQSVAEMAGIRLPSELPIFNLLVRKPALYQLGRFLSAIFPAKIWSFVWTVYFNIVSLMMGAGYVDATIADQHPFAVRPFLQSWRDIVDPSKAVINHPFILGEYVRKEVTQWRDQCSELLMNERAQILAELRTSGGHPSQVDKLNACDKELERIKFAVPPQFRCEPPTEDSIATSLNSNLAKLWTTNGAPDSKQLSGKVNPQYVENLKNLYSKRLHS